MLRLVTDLTLIVWGGRRDTGIIAAYVHQFRLAMDTVPEPIDDDGLYGLHRALTEVRFTPRQSFETQLLRSLLTVAALRKPGLPPLLLVALAGAAVMLGVVLYLLWRTILHLGR